jgi:hypothetical protein
MFEYPHLNVQTTTRNVILKQLGFTVCPHMVNIGGKAKKVWYRRPLTNDEIRLYLRDEGAYEDDFSDL